MARSLQRLLAPKSIAVIGGKEAARVVEQCIRFGFQGAIWPVHPEREEMHGYACFRSLADLPHPPDAAYVAVNRKSTIDAVAQLSKTGCGGAICYAAGFAEADGEDAEAPALQRRLLEAAGDMPIIGPNCYGILNAMDGAALWPDQHGLARVDSGVAILTQSSNLAISLTMQRRGLPVAFVGTVGNQAQTGLSDMALSLLEDPRITALGLHVEGLDDVKAFERLALDAREKRKPFIVLKTGRSEQAQAAALTHTASLAGGDKAHDALFRRLGVARVGTVDQFLETLKLIHCGGALAGNRVISLSCSGGEAALMADAGEGRDIVFPAFSEVTKAALKSELGPLVAIANPLDYNTFIWGDWQAMQRMYRSALSSDQDLAMLVLDFPRADTCDTSDWDHALDAWLAATQHTGARTAVVSTMSENMPEDVARKLMEADITPLCGLENAMAATEAAACIGQAWDAPASSPLLSRGNPHDLRTDIHSKPHRQKSEAESLITLDEFQSKQELATFGLRTPKGVLLNGNLEVSFDLEPPFALKALGIAHKTEAGAVRLNLKNRQDVMAALAEMSDLAECFLLEEMAAKPDAELIIGISRDPVVGLMMTLGAGGVLAELLADTATLLLPATEADIREALSGLRINRILQGWRGGEATDIDALIANIMCVANYAVANVETLEELDVNPLFATQFGSVAVDALIVKRKLS